MRVLTRGLESLAEAIATSGDVSLSDAVFHGGSHSLRTNAPGTSAAWAKFGRADGSAFDLPAIYARVWVRVAAFPNVGTEEFLGIESAGGGKFYIRLAGAGVRTLSFRDSSGSFILGAGTTVLAVDTWYCLEVMVGKETNEAANNGPWAVRINGNAEAGGTGNVGAANTAFVKLGCTVNRGAAGIDCYFDDLAVDDADWPGMTDPPAVNVAAIAQHYRRMRCS
jgi:hypothetical protein